MVMAALKYKTLILIISFLLGGIIVVTFVKVILKFGSDQMNISCTNVLLKRKFKFLNFFFV